jgi:DNA-binding MarR family transcriptional regulator
MQQSRSRPARALLDLGIAVTRLVRAHAAHARPAGLTLVEFRALSLVDSAPDLLLKELATLMGLTPATVSRLAARLVRRGLLRRRTDRADRRAVNFRLTPRGLRALHDATDAVEAVLASRLRRLPAGEQRALVRLSRRVVADLSRPGQAS